LVEASYEERGKFVLVGNKNVLSSDVIIFDLDGVLIDNTERYKLALAEVDPNTKIHEELRGGKISVFWRVFLSSKYIDRDKPVDRAVEMLRERREKYPVVILSGRTSNVLNETVDQLNRFSIDFDVLIMRREGTYIKDADFKKSVVEELGLQVAEVHDDSPYVIEALLPYASRGTFYWYRVGKYVYIPPVRIMINGQPYVISTNDEERRKAIDAVQGSAIAEIRYAGYVVRLPRDYAVSFVDSLYSTLPQELCYPACRYSVELLPFTKVLTQAGSKKYTVSIAGVKYPSIVDLDIDEMLQSLRLQQRHSEYSKTEFY